MKLTLATVAAALLATAGAASADKAKFEYWYGLTGDLGAVVLETCNRFNASQDLYEATCVGQDGYEKAVQNTIAAFRASKHPTLLQSFDAGNVDLMLSGEFYPVTKLMADTGVTIDWADYFPGIANYYSSKAGEFFSMPWNSSTPVYYFNKDHFAKGRPYRSADHLGRHGGGSCQVEGIGAGLRSGLCALGVDRHRAVLDGAQRAGRIEQQRL